MDIYGKITEALVLMEKRQGQERYVRMVLQVLKAKKLQEKDDIIFQLGKNDFLETRSVKENEPILYCVEFLQNLRKDKPKVYEETIEKTKRLFSELN
ncbi:hypothetical protein AALA24_09910 [Anaerovoracaceae bacterium 42-11]